MKKSKHDQNSTTIIYQWNCRGIKNKLGELSLHIENLEQKPDVIALQETNDRPKLAGYITYTDPSEKSTAILVRSNIAATQQVTAQRGCEHVLIEIHNRSIGNEKNFRTQCLLPAIEKRSRLRWHPSGLHQGSKYKTDTNAGGLQRSTHTMGIQIPIKNGQTTS